MEYPYGVPSPPVLSPGHSDGEIVYYIDTLDNQDNCHVHGLYPSSPQPLACRSNSVCSQSEKPQRPRRSIDSGYSIKRGTGQMGGKPRPKSSTKFTPLGDERRACIRKKSPSGRRRSVSTGETRRKSSARALSADCQDIKARKDADESQTQTEQMRRHRKVVALVLGIFMFLLVASVVVVVVTLTHSSFHSPPVGNRELARHRAQQNQPLRRSKIAFRKENEELLNSLNRDTSVPDNSTTAPL